MSDYLRITWARFHLDISRHSQAMVKFINTPAPRPGDILRVPVGTGDVETNFVLSFPGMMNLETEGFVGVDYAMWPIFRCLSAESILKICEVGRFRFSFRKSLKKLIIVCACVLNRSLCRPLAVSCFSRASP
jgi:hypothetical protein